MAPQRTVAVAACGHTLCTGAPDPLWLRPLCKPRTATLPPPTTRPSQQRSAAPNRRTVRVHNAWRISLKTVCSSPARDGEEEGECAASQRQHVGAVWLSRAPYPMCWRGRCRTRVEGSPPLATRRSQRHSAAAACRPAQRPRASHSCWAYGGTGGSVTVAAQGRRRCDGPNYAYAYLIGRFGGMLVGVEQQFDHVRRCAPVAGIV